VGKRKKQNTIHLYEDHVEIIIESQKYGTFHVLIDKEDLPLVDRVTWRIDKSPSKPRYGPYVMGYDTELKKDVKLHRLILNAPPGTPVDHINRDGLDNRKQNLRLVSHSQNQSNRTHNYSNKVGLKGVWIQKSGKFSARLSRRIPTKQEFTAGPFTAPEEAAHAYNMLAIKHLDEEYILLNDTDNYVRTPAVLEAIKKQSIPLRRKLQGRRKNKATGFYGVYYRPAGSHKTSRDTYEARFAYDGVKYYAGTYDTAEEAARAYDIKIKELCGQRAVLNFPEDKQ